jgi:hypothetical protein
MRKETAACPATAFAARRLLPAVMPAAATVVFVLLAALLLLGTSGGSAAAGGAAGPTLAARRLALDRERPTAARVRSAAPQNAGGAQLLQAQVVFRHGARTPLATLYYPQDFRWTNCAAGMGYAGARLALRDAAGGGTPPPITDRDSPALPGGCAAGILTEQGWCARGANATHP